ncbi:MAG: Terpene cyclase [Candidatus Parcubacteria bacterium]|jgi:hypothetical protein
MNLKQIYFGAFVIGTAVPTYFAVSFMIHDGALNVLGFIRDLFANYASSTFSSDLLIASFVFWIFLWHDAKDREVPSIG